MDQRIAAILTAIGERKTLTIVYHGGSQPGTARDIQPLRLADDVVFARDLTTDEERAFRVDKIELPAAGDAIHRYSRTPEIQPEARTQTIGETFAPLVEELRALGWGVEVGMNAVGVFSFFKNGKPRKTATVWLQFDEWIYDYTEDGRDVMRRSSRPYCVRSARFQPARSFARLEPAAEMFMTEAAGLAPHRS